MKRKLPTPITILFFVIIIAAIATWLIPAGKYHTLEYREDAKSFVYKNAEGEISLPLAQTTLDSLNIRIPIENFASGAIRKPVSVPGTYESLKSENQGWLEVLQAPIKGITDSIDIIFFILVIGGFMHIFNESGAMVTGLSALSLRMKGRESWLIIIMTFLFAFGGGSFGMAEEGLVFYAVITPLFIKAGYDLLVPVAVIFGGTQLGTLSSFTNPFSTIIASNAAGVNWTDGIYMRLTAFVLTTALFIWYIIRYANKVKKDPSASLVYRIDGNVTPVVETAADKGPMQSSAKTNLLNAVFLLTFLAMVGGVVALDWWLLEMTTLFIGASILLGLILRLRERVWVDQFITGAQSMLGVALIVGIARGVTVVLNEGKIADSILFYAAGFADSMPPVLFIVLMLVMYMVFTLFISSSSGMAVLTMPIIGGLATLVNVPGREIVNAYLYGMGIMGFITPTGLILPSLALVNVSLKTWLKFITPFLVMLFVLCAIMLIIGLYI